MIRKADNECGFELSVFGCAFSCLLTLSLLFVMIFIVAVAWRSDPSTAKIANLEVKVAALRGFDFNDEVDRKETYPSKENLMQRTLKIEEAVILMRGTPRGSLKIETNEEMVRRLDMLSMQIDILIGAAKAGKISVVVDNNQY